MVIYNYGISQNYKYEFKIQEITNPSQAKVETDKIRALVGAKIVYFNDESDTFQVFTHISNDIGRLTSKFEANGLPLDGEILIFEIE